jgi:spore coat polysaccharide biosynthesis protein SpsF
MIIAIIQARMGSTRLPGKVMKKISNKPLLYYVVERVKKSKYVEKIVIATTDKEEDNIIEEYAGELNVECFRGSEKDVLDRYYKAAKKYNAQVVARITADCPLLDPQIMDNVIELFLKEKCDYATNTMPATFPDGLDVEVLSFRALEKAWKNAILESDREHVTSYIRRHPEIFTIKNLKNDENLSHLRWTVDRAEDLVFMREVYRKFYPREIFYMSEIRELIERDPRLLEINRGIARDEGYIKSLTEDKIIRDCCVYELITQRRSIRKFRQKKISLELLIKCVNAARLAPSSGNLQPLEYLIIIDKERKDEVFKTLKWARYLQEEAIPKEKEKPTAYIIVLHNRKVSSRSVDYDVGFACENIILTALEEGVASCVIGAIDREQLAKDLQIPINYEIKLVIALGYPRQIAIAEDIDVKSLEDLRYWRDEQNIHHVPKRKLEDIMHINRIK